MTAPPLVSLLVLRGVRAVDPARSLDDEIDVVIENGRVSRLGRGAATSDVCAAEGARVIDAKGLWALPAFVDLHAHLREPGQTHKEDIASGLAAAAAGGFAHVCAMPNTTPVNDTSAVTKAMRARAREVSAVSLHAIAAITLGQAGSELAPLAELRDAGAVAISDDGRCVTSSAVMLAALREAARLDFPVIQHAEDHALTEGATMHDGPVAKKLGLRGWPRVAEDIIVARDVLLAESAGARYHLAHASTAGSVRILREAKARGLAVTAEVTPHHLLLTHERLVGYDTACKVNPPLRETADIEALREALANGTIDAIATDHAPHAASEKARPFIEAPPGMIGLELVFPVLLGLVRDGVLPLARLIDALTRAPASIARLDAPSLREGSVAELCLVDPNERWTIAPERLRSRSHNTPFLGTEVTGRVRMTLASGRVAFEAEA